jgi:hypothetical protein
VSAAAREPASVVAARQLVDDAHRARTQASRRPSRRTGLARDGVWPVTAGDAEQPVAGVAEDGTRSAVRSAITNPWSATADRTATATDRGQTDPRHGPSEEWSRPDGRPGRYAEERSRLGNAPDRARRAEGREP